MGCPSEVEVGDNLVFTVCTHNPETAAMTDADTTPTYMVFNESWTALLIGSLAKRNNIVGFYGASIACTTANGFSNGKSYTILVTATVGGEAGSISFAFKAKEIEAGVTPTKALQRIGAMAAGVVSGAGTSTETFKGLDGTTNRVQATVDASGNRTIMTYDP